MSDEQNKKYRGTSILRQCLMKIEEEDSNAMREKATHEVNVDPDIENGKRVGYLFSKIKVVWVALLRRLGINRPPVM